MQLALFLAISLGLLASFGAWNAEQWTDRQNARYDGANPLGKLRVIFENGNISPAIAERFYRWGISLRPLYVVVGQDGWMYLGDQFEQVASRAVRGIPELDEPMLDRWTDQLRQRQDWLTSRGIRSLFAIAPNKHSIYPEHSPEWMPFAEQQTVSTLTSAAEGAGVRIVATAPAIQRLKSDRDWLYNRNDTHWMAPAAFAGYQEIIRALDSELALLSESDVSYELRPQPDGGLSRVLGFAELYDASEDPYFHTLIRGPADRFCKSFVDLKLQPSGPCRPMGDVRVLSRFRKVVQVDNPDALNDLSVLLVQDSFGVAPSRFFNHSFSRVWHAHQGYMSDVNRFREFVEKFQPDAVIVMAVERNLLRPMVYEFDGASGDTEVRVE